jgi:PilZ domain
MRRKWAARKIYTGVRIIVSAYEHQRRWRRYNMQRPVWVTAEAREELPGTTRDVSAGGMFFFSRVEIPKDTNVDVRFPPLLCSGRVVRLESQGGTGLFGIAVAFEQVHVVPGGI